LTKIALLIWALNITVDTVGHMSFKYAAIVDHQTELGRWKSMLSSFPIWLGMACFVCEFVLWLAFLSIMPLSLGILIGSINMVTIMFAGRILFKERLDRMRIIGMTFICIGVALAGGFS
jgi:drug/metabolite transporter (DMT)-like permease